MATVVSERIELPVPVLQYPHWRVVFQPDRYLEDRIPSLTRCIELVQQCHVRLRGWAFPHLSQRDDERRFANNYLASWAEHTDVLEYWRLYQSGQFLLLNAVEEAVRRGRKEESANGAECAKTPPSPSDSPDAPSHIGFLNFFYRIVEVFEFAARLSDKGVYENELDISIQLKGIRGFALAFDIYHPRTDRRTADTDDLSMSWTYAVPILVAKRSELSLKAAVWFFERFHWLDPPLEVLRREQQNFLRGLV